LARELLMQAVAEYRPGSEVQDLVWMRKKVLAAHDHGKVTAIAPRRAKLGH